MNERASATPPISPEMTWCVFFRLMLILDTDQTLILRPCRSGQIDA